MQPLTSPKCTGKMMGLRSCFTQFLLVVVLGLEELEVGWFGLVINNVTGEGKSKASSVITSDWNVRAVDSDSVDALQYQHQHPISFGFLSQVRKETMTPVQTKLYTDDVSLLMVLLDINPSLWSATSSSSVSFSTFLSHVLAFLNSIHLLNQLNQVVVIATGLNTCDYIYDSAAEGAVSNGRVNTFLEKLEEFVVKDEQLNKEDVVDGVGSSLLSGSLSMALCYIQRVFRSGSLHPHPRILCLHGSPDGPGQYVAVMNSIFSAQRSMVPIDSCVIGAQNSAFLQQASYITGGVYLKPPQLEGLFQYLSTVFATDLHSRRFLQLPKPVGVDFRASCFCHKNTIDTGYICSVCLSIFCKRHEKCSTCGSVLGQAQNKTSSSTSTGKRKTRET